jgi:hypothetical protein
MNTPLEKIFIVGTCRFAKELKWLIEDINRSGEKALWSLEALSATVEHDSEVSPCVK